MDARNLSDRYEVEEPLGHGGMADVVAATDTRLGRRVAIKILREDLARDPAFVRRFESEALAAARLNHPGIVSVFDVGEEQPDARGGLPPERRRVGMVFQKPTPFPMSIYENVAFGLRLQGRLPKRKRDDIIEWALTSAALWDEVKDRLHHSAWQLSGGQQQQLAIGRELASRPQLLILDEPTEGIQPSVIKEIGEVIRQLANRGDMAILLVEQFYDFAEELADAYTVMARGQVIAQGAGCEMPAKGIRELVAI